MCWCSVSEVLHSHLHDRPAARSVAEIGLLSLRLSISQGVSLVDFPLAPTCPIEKVTLWEGFFYLTSGSEAISIVK